MADFVFGFSSSDIVLNNVTLVVTRFACRVEGVVVLYSRGVFLKLLFAPNVSTRRTTGSKGSRKFDVLVFTYSLQVCTLYIVFLLKATNVQEKTNVTLSLPL